MVILLITSLSKPCPAPGNPGFWPLPSCSVSLTKAVLTDHLYPCRDALCYSTGHAPVQRQCSQHVIILMAIRIVVSLFLESRKWSPVGLFQLIITIHLKSIIKIGSLPGNTLLRMTAVVCDDLEGRKRLGFQTQAFSLLELWICERLINTVQKQNKDLRRGMLLLKRLQMQFTDESRKSII